MFVVGLTGGIGSGKSTVADYFAELGIDIIDADVAARAVVVPGSDALAEITAHFGQRVIDAQGQLRRPLLREIIFNEPEERTWLEALLHPLIADHIKTCLAESQSPYCLLVSPLLLETDQNKLTNRVLIVDIDEKLQLQRALERDNSKAETIRAIIAAQMPRAERLEHADDVVDNNSDLSSLRDRVNALHQLYLEMATSV